MAHVVETIVAERMADLKRQLDRPSRADLQELRLDAVRDLDPRGVLDGRRLPVIVTCRPHWEGGMFDGSEEERRAILVQAARLGADYVDVEWRAEPRLFEECRVLTKVVLSHHDFAGVPTDLADRWDAMRRMDAAVTKIAVTARSLGDCVALKRVVSGPGEHVAIAMGPAGQLTRVWPAWFGSRWTYTGTAAPGQTTLDQAIDVYRVRDTRANTTPYGIAGSPLGHSASPAMHNAAFAALGMDAVYVPLHTASADDFFATAEAIGLQGASVTIPLKQALLTPAVTGDDLVRQTGALNTLRRRESGWEGRNFDVAGFLAPLEARKIALRGVRATVLGAGGAARGAAHVLATAGASVRISARRQEAAQRLAGDLGVSVAEWPPTEPWDLMVNTTPVGTWPDVDAAPLPAAVLGPATGKVVYDLVYNPPHTRLLRLAAAAGATTIGGLEMLVSQACRQFEWWTSQPAPRDVMHAAAESFLKATSCL